MTLKRKEPARPNLRNKKITQPKTQKIKKNEDSEDSFDSEYDISEEEGSISDGDDVYDPKKEAKVIKNNG